jgi:hypothetical protein
LAFSGAPPSSTAYGAAASMPFKNRFAVFNFEFPHTEKLKYCSGYL